MADEVRKSQEGIEIAYDLFIEVRDSQHALEVAFPIPIETKRTQDIIEISADIPANTRITQNIIEIIPTAPDVSGVYFINPDKAEWNDTYYGDREVPGSPKLQKKIPDPTVRTALFGE